MKILDVTLKDLRRSFLNAFFLMFGLGVPLLTGVLFYFAFGDAASGDGFDLPTTQVQVVNLDEASSQYGGLSVGRMLVEFLGSEELGELLEVTEAADAASARAAVDSQAADVAVIVPAGFTATTFDPAGRAAVELYQDPTLTLGPGIVKGLVSQLVDGFAGTKIAAGVTYEQLSRQGATVDPAVLQDVAMQYASWSAEMGQSQQTGERPLLDLRSPAGGEEESRDRMGGAVGLVMSGMMVFYVFFTGAASAQSILQEEETGTLPRLFTTPTPQSTILGGKLIATFVTLFVQVAVLVTISSLVFGIDWGAPLPVAFVTLGLVVLSGSFGIFVTSLLKNTRQSGIVYGGVMTVLGMLGMISVFTADVPDASRTADTVALFVPQGWGVRGWQLLLEGGGVNEVLSTVVVMLALGIGFFVVGVLRFRKRFA